MAQCPGITDEEFDSLSEECKILLIKSHEFLESEDCKRYQRWRDYGLRSEPPATLEDLREAARRGTEIFNEHGAEMLAELFREQQKY